jgi:hypothetical protein
MAYTQMEFKQKNVLCLKKIIACMYNVMHTYVVMALVRHSSTLPHFHHPLILTNARLGVATYAITFVFALAHQTTHYPDRVMVMMVARDALLCHRLKSVDGGFQIKVTTARRAAPRPRPVSIPFLCVTCTLTPSFSSCILCMPTKSYSM